MNLPTESNVKVPEHHKQLELCKTRPLYRQGRKLTAVKVYTVNNESSHILIYNVPSINLIHELTQKCLSFGQIKLIQPEDQYKEACEEFTECYHVNYERIQAARIAKRMLDTQSFYGGILHVCYAPEYETLDELRNKLNKRRKDIALRLNPNWENQTKSRDNPVVNRKRKYPGLPLDEDRIANAPVGVWSGIPEEIDPRIDKDEPLVKKHYSLPKRKLEKSELPVYGPNLDGNFRNEKLALKKEVTERVKRIVFTNTQ